MGLFVKYGSWAVACAFALGVAPSTAHAGAKTFGTVSVSKSSSGAGTATGSVSGARYSSDNYEYVSCYSYYYPGNQSSIMGCSARDSSGQVLYCSSTQPDYVAMARNINAASFIMFDVDATGQCSGLFIGNGSNDLP